MLGLLTVAVGIIFIFLALTSVGVRLQSMSVRDIFGRYDPSPETGRMYCRSIYAPPLRLSVVAVFLSSFNVTAAQAQSLLTWSNPVGGETFAVGDTIPLAWTGGDPNTTVSITLVDTVGGVSLGVIIGPTPNDGSESWQIPASVLPTNVPKDFQFLIVNAAQTYWKYGGVFSVVPDDGQGASSGTTGGGDIGDQPSELPFATEHFQCYDIDDKPLIDIPVTLVDQFGSSKNVVVRAKYLCAPADKNGEGMTNEADHLMLYELEKRIPVGKKVEVTNQFGKQRYTVLDSRLIAVPSLKKVIESQGKIDFGIKKQRFELGTTTLYTLLVENQGAPLDVPPATLSIVDHVPSGMFVNFLPVSDWSCPTTTIAGPASATCAWTGASPVPQGLLTPIQLIAARPGGGPFRNCAEVVVGGGVNDNHPADNESGACDNDDNDNDNDGADASNLRIKKNALEPAGQPETKAEGFACVAGLRSAASLLNMRAGPSGSANVLKRLPQGTALRILATSGDWVRVEVLDKDRSGTTGWVASRFTEKIGDPSTCKAPGVIINLTPKLLPETGLAKPSGPIVLPGIELLLNP
jgi:SH3 domain-containing protein/Ser-Thr-rich glycosyl-phosphatidyl-inositol-anchored membrane family protein